MNPVTEPLVTESIVALCIKTSYGSEIKSFLAYKSEDLYGKVFLIKLELLKSYKDKAYIMGILCELSNNHYTFVKNMINIPLILINTSMTILNSIIEDSNDLKIPNIILNSLTGVIIGLVSSFKVYEKIQTFHQLQSKFNKLTSNIEKELILNIDDITSDEINNFIETYDNLIDNMEYPISHSIKDKVKKKFEEKLTLPAILTVDIVECRDNCC